MHLQSELENYKLQVELLQEKLHRSEDNRHELEVKLEQIMKKRSEHETALRSSSQRKYQQFLDEQKKRNERNRKLVEMLERIDQQAAALAARSERLKMMKLQYEFYFARLAQSYSLKTLQNIPAVPFLPIQKSTNAYTSENLDNGVRGEQYSRSFNAPTTQFQTVPIPVVVPISNDQNRFSHNWAFAAPPQGVIISLANNTSLSSTGVSDSKKNEPNFSLDYSKFPIGYIQTPTGMLPMQYAVDESHLKHYNLPKETHAKTLLTPGEDTKTSKPYSEFKDQSPVSFSFADIKRNETLFNGTQLEQNQKPFSSSSEKTITSDVLDLNKEKEEEVNTHEPVNLRNFQVPEMSNSDSLMPRQSLKVDILSNISPNNSLQQRTENGRIEHRGNKSNAIDFRTDGDDDDYIKYIKEMKETYEKNVPIPINSLRQEQSIDNIMTTLQVQKIDETTVKDDEKINDIENNEKNTSSAFPSLGGKCSMESIGDEALTKKSLENKTTENTSYTAARNIDPSRDTEQITLFNGTKNSRDESIGASNRTTAIIDGGGENVDNNKNTPLETSYRPMHFDKKEKMSIESIETAIYGELLPKPEALPSTSLLDIPPVSDDGREDNMQHTRESKQYEFDLNNSQADVYKQNHDPVVEQEEKVYPSPMGNELVDTASSREAETNQQSYDYGNNNETNEIQQYDGQDFMYPDVTQEGKDAMQPELPQQNYTFAEHGQQPQTDSYVNDYQNYDTTQYQTNYDPNTYQYEYEQPYTDSNEAQYATEMYNQEYSQDPYSEEYANYDQNASSDMEVSNQPYVEQQYTPEDQAEQTPSDEIEKPIPVEQELEETKTEEEISKQYISNINEPNEESITKKQSTPTSILSTERHTDLSAKKKKRVNFVDSETDDSNTLPKPEAGSSESDFDFSEK